VGIGEIAGVARSARRRAVAGREGRLLPTGQPIAQFDGPFDEVTGFVNSPSGPDDLGVDHFLEVVLVHAAPLPRTRPI